MSSTLRTIGEWINPNRGRHRTVPPMDTGLRPNLRLDEARELLPPGRYEPDDVVITRSGAAVFSSGSLVFDFRDGEAVLRAEFSGRVAALADVGDDVVAAVEGRGLCAISPSGAVSEICTDPSVTSCVTALTATPDGALLVAVGSTAGPSAEWARSLVTGDRSGRIVRVDGARARVVAEGLAWPSGIGMASDRDVLVSISLEHRVELRELAALGHRGRTVTANLPIYPGRMSADDDGYWFAAPYVRNRVTEMLLDEPEVLAEMVGTISRDEWFVPRLHSGDPFTETMQMGQLRVLGIVKSWAPARSCGLVFRMDRMGRVVESAHARVDSNRHGVTGVAVRDGQVIAAARGYGNLLKLQAHNR
ncbi:hypothetical protein [Rhodococcus sp. T7]|uniref:hypothetical protein n=1 Tax=Rhodococcus sp. T7 TaxID=627444 RepID=UPI00135CA6DB|nr:hypothetical protein [Rhodococcus sp. T7]KAF0964810.1 hypothetical protein MLGJGCBP_02104 [Rhodococcus sp. T7]